MIRPFHNVQRLWADGDVMRFVGFPNGLHQTSEEMKGWFQWIEWQAGADHPDGWQKTDYSSVSE